MSEHEAILARWVRADWEAQPILAVMAFADAAGAAPLNGHPGCWEGEVDGTWTLVVNGHEEPKFANGGETVEPFTAHVYFNGWPTAILDADGEGEFAVGSEANPAMFAAAIEAAIRRMDGRQ